MVIFSSCKWCINPPKLEKFLRNEPERGEAEVVFDDAEATSALTVVATLAAELMVELTAAGDVNSLETDAESVVLEATDVASAADAVTDSVPATAAALAEVALAMAGAGVADASLAL